MNEKQSWYLLHCTEDIQLLWLMWHKAVSQLEEVLTLVLSCWKHFSDFFWLCLHIQNILEQVKADSIVEPFNLYLQIQEILGHIEAGDLLPPLVVLQVLGKNPRLKLSLVKDYISRQLEAESRHIREDLQQIAKYAQETQEMRKETEQLRTQVSDNWAFGILILNLEI